MKDPFRPHTELARALYDALQQEAKKRNGREFNTWHKAEVYAVYNAACQYAQSHGLIEPTLSQVSDAESLASGHADYCAQWARNVARVM